MTDAATEEAPGTLNWIRGVLEGDFNENPTVGQIIANAAITAIPLVDQAADARDLVANLKALIWDKRYTEIAVWLGLFFTLIGLIPSLGSLLKGVLKLVYRGAKLDEVFKVFNALAKGNAWEWLKKLRAGELRQHADEAARMLKQVFDNIIDTLNEALSYVPHWAGDLYGKISDLITEMRMIRNQIEEMFGKITQDLEEKLDDLLKKQADNSVEGESRQTLLKRQEAEAPPPPPIKSSKEVAEEYEKLDGGHSLARHGPEVSDQALENRILTGQAADGKFSPTDSSTRFRSYDDWVETRQAAIDTVQTKHGVDFGENMDIPPQPGTPAEYNGVVIDHQRAIDEGFNGAGQRIKIKDPSNSGKTGKVYTQTTTISGITKTQTSIKWNANTQRWVVSQHFPVGRGWNQSTQSY